jgi:hypothetical protein
VARYSLAEAEFGKDPFSISIYLTPGLGMNGVRTYRKASASRCFKYLRSSYGSENVGGAVVSSWMKASPGSPEACSTCCAVAFARATGSLRLTGASTAGSTIADGAMLLLRPVVDCHAMKQVREPSACEPECLSMGRSIPWLSIQSQKSKKYVQHWPFGLVAAIRHSSRLWPSPLATRTVRNLPELLRR